MPRILQRNPARREAPQPVEVVEHASPQKQKTRAELIEEQLAKQPAFDNEPIKKAERAVSRTGLVPRIVGKGYDAQKQVRQAAPESKQEFQPERLETIDRPRAEEARPTMKSTAAQSPPSYSTEMFQSQDTESEPPKQSSELKTKPQPVAAVRRESKLPSVPADTLIPAQALSNKANPSHSEIYVETLSVAKPVCYECGQPLNIMLLQGEVPGRQLCGFCAEKKMKEVKLLQMRLLNEKKKQNLERLTMMTAGIPSQSSSQTLDLSKQQPVPQVQGQLIDFEEKMRKYDAEMSLKNEEIERMKQELQEQIVKAAAVQEGAPMSSAVPSAQPPQPAAQSQNNALQVNEIPRPQPATQQPQYSAPQVQVEVQKPEVQIVQKHVIVDQSPLLAAIQQLNAGVLQNFPFIVQRKICPCCNEVTGFQIVDTNGNQVTPGDLTKSLSDTTQEKPQPKQEDPRQLTLAKQKKKRAQKKNMQQLMELDERLAQLQIYNSKPFASDPALPGASILSGGTQEMKNAGAESSVEDSGMELGFAFKKQ